MSDIFEELFCIFLSVVFILFVVLCTKCFFDEMIDYAEKPELEVVGFNKEESENIYSWTDEKTGIEYLLYDDCIVPRYPVNCDVATAPQGLYPLQ